MELVTRQTRANTAAARWRAYARSIDVRNKLIELGPTPNPDDVDRIAGEGWTDVPHCDECGEDVGVVVMVGESPDFESSTAYVCKECILRALTLINEKDD